MEEHSIRLIIEGDVQGVGYRWWIVSEANTRGLNGWVRNLSNGCVEVVISGDCIAVNDLKSLCWTGPPNANVTSIEENITSIPEEHGFKTYKTI